MLGLSSSGFTHFCQFVWINVGHTYILWLLLVSAHGYLEPRFKKMWLFFSRHAIHLHFSFIFNYEKDCCLYFLDLFCLFVCFGLICATTQQYLIKNNTYIGKLSDSLKRNSVFWDTRQFCNHRFLYKLRFENMSFVQKRQKLQVWEIGVIIFFFFIVKNNALF